MDFTKALSHVITHQIAERFGNPIGWDITDAGIRIPLGGTDEIAVLTLRPQPGMLIINTAFRSSGRVDKGRTVQVLPIPESGRKDVFRQALKAVNSAVYQIDSITSARGVDLLDTDDDADTVEVA